MCLPFWGAPTARSGSFHRSTRRLKLVLAGQKASVSVGSIAAKGRRAGQSQWVERLGRAGLVAQGVLYAVIGILALKIALGVRDEAPDKSGALREIAQQPFGKFLLIVLAIGFGAHALWRLAEAILDSNDQANGLKGLMKRLGYLGRAGLYGTLCALTIAKIVGASDGGGGNEQETTGGVLAMPLGRWIVLAVGLGFLVAAGYQAYRAVTCKFEGKLKKGEMNEVEEKGSIGLGIVGYTARAVVWSLVGAFLVKAAWEYDPKEARGLDGALLELAQQPYGRILLGVVSAGLIAFGLYCFVQARYRRI
jgi:fumarate reductase subunit D